MEPKKKILFTYSTLSTFVKTDFEILSEKHVVTRYQFKPVKGLINTALQFGKQFIFLLFGIWKFDMVFIWFADFHSFLPVLFAKILNKKSVVVIGGYDVVKMPKLNYGVFTSKIRGYCSLFSMRKSTLNLAVSENVKRKVRWIAKKSNTILIYNCINIPENKSLPENKENLILTVGIIDSKRTFYLKGMDTFTEVAGLLPQFRFMVVGMNKDLPSCILRHIPENIEFIERVNHNELENYYKKARVYCQFSRSESFGVAIVEAMYFNCIPVVTNVGGMPELFRNYGFVTPRDALEISRLIANVMNKTAMLLTDTDKNIALKPFLFSERKQKLTEQINQLF